MTGKTHVVGGIAFSAGTVALLSTTNPNSIDLMSGISMIAMGGLGGLVPDIDQRQSMISRIILPIAWPLWIIQKILLVI